MNELSDSKMEEVASDNDIRETTVSAKPLAEHRTYVTGTLNFPAGWLPGYKGVECNVCKATLTECVWPYHIKPA